VRWAALIALASCAPIPPPDVLRAVDKARAAPAVSQAAEAAPAALAHAAELQAEAHRAFERGDLSGAELLGEQALAAYERSKAIEDATNWDPVKGGPWSRMAIARMSQLGSSKNRRR